MNLQNYNKTKKYRLTYPHISNNIYKSISLKGVIKKCYKDFKSINDIDEGLFAITNLDDNIEYQFRVKNKKIFKINKQLGGDIKLNIPQTETTSLVTPNIVNQSNNNTNYYTDQQNESNNINKEEVNEMIDELKQVDEVLDDKENNVDDERLRLMEERLNYIDQEINYIKNQQQNIQQNIQQNMQQSPIIEVISKEFEIIPENIIIRKDENNFEWCALV